MKSIFFLLSVTFFLGRIAIAVDSQALSKTYVYQCQNRLVTVHTDGTNFKVSSRYQMPSSHVVNIESDLASMDQLRLAFTGEGSMTDPTDALTTGLPDGSLGFTGFHYPKGEMFMTAEGDTNEEGYLFAAEPGLLQGQAAIEASDIYWNDRRPSEITKFTCTLVN